MKKRILFVDDQSNVLNGLRRMLHPMQQDWDMTFAPGGHEALHLMQQGKYDVIVSDLRMPRMPGEKLLATVRDKYPNMIRIALSGQGNTDSMINTAGAIHQFLHKPCDPAKLRDTISKCSEVNSLIRDERLKSRLISLEGLPTLSGTKERMMKELNNPHVSMSTIGKIVKEDPGLSTLMLKVVNSAFYGLANTVGNPVQAASLLGIEFIKALIISQHILDHIAGKQESEAIKIYWQRSLIVASLTQKFAQLNKAKGNIVEQSFLSGLLHNLGQIFVTTHLPEAQADIEAFIREGELPHIAEEKVLQVDQASVGGYLLKLWGFDPLVYEAVKFHRIALLHTGNEVLGYLYLANRLIDISADQDMMNSNHEIIHKIENIKHILNLDFLTQNFTQAQINEWIGEWIIMHQQSQNREVTCG